MLRGLCVLALGLAVVTALPVEEGPVGYSALESQLISLAKVGKYDVAFTNEDMRQIVANIHPFHKYEEAKENVVLMDEFPYVPVVQVPKFNSSFVLSNLVLRENYNLALTKVEFEPGWQSLFFLDIPLTATFDWKLNETDVGGKAIVKVPHSWVHQNIEAGCSHDQSSILVWEGRVDVYPSDIDILTTYDNKELMDAFAAAMHEQVIVRKYIANAMQHQMASFIGKVHWKLQNHMRDLCLTCVSARANNSTFVVRLGSDPKCVASVPGFLWDRLASATGSVADLQHTIKDKLLEELLKSDAFKPPVQSKDERFEIQGLVSTLAEPKPTKAKQFDHLKPKHDPRDKYKKAQLPDGFARDAAPAPSPWRQKLGNLYMALMGRPQLTVGAKGTNATATK